MNAEGLDIIRRYEGLRLKAYQCPAGIWTVGYGHTGPDVEPWTVISEELAEKLLRKDVTAAQTAVLRRVTVPLNENQRSALISFVLNVGAGAFGNSTMRVLINRKAHLDAANQFPRWNKANGKVLAGLTKRREEERALYLRPVIVT